MLFWGNLLLFVFLSPGMTEMMGESGGKEAKKGDNFLGGEIL